MSWCEMRTDQTDTGSGVGTPSVSHMGVYSESWRAGRPKSGSRPVSVRRHERVLAALDDLLDDLPKHGEWMPNASCRGTDPELWHPSARDGPPPLLEMCTRCPVRRECFTVGVVTGQAGAWGGSSERLRKDVRNALGLPREIFSMPLDNAPALARTAAHAKQSVDSLALTA